MVVLVDYGAGNVTSVARALAAVGGPPRLVRRPREAPRASAVVIPGVGHFGATAPLEEWRRPLLAAIDAGVPVLGICLGMHWLFEGSDEAPGTPGLGLFAGRIFRLPAGDGVKVPHVGWNTLDGPSAAGHRPPSRLLEGLGSNAMAYFTHSYAAPVSGATTAVTTHGAPFASIVERDRVFGVQFHPEKSGRIGLGILARFFEVVRQEGVSCSLAG
jgi:glutamine amidotransferase